MNAKESTKAAPKKPFKKNGIKKPFSKGQSRAPKKNLPPLAFMIFDLTDKALDALIIKITQLTVFENGETELQHHFFNNEDREISADAFAHHHITAEELKDKPKVTSFDFNVAKNIVVWDGQVTRSILAKNNITKFPPIINMHSLARYLEDIPKPIRLNDYALKANPKKRNQIEFQLKKAEKKIHVLPEIFEHLKSQYSEKYTENSPSFLVSVGKCRTKKLAMEAIKTYLAKRAEIQKNKPSQRGNKKHVKPQQQTTADKKVIVVNTTLSQNNQGVKAVVVKKRAK